MDELENIEVASVAELRAWLEENYGQEESVWLVTYKKAVLDKYVSIGEVLDELLCFGWMDGRRKKLDEERTMQLVSPRKTQHWAKSYKERVARLTQEGRMHEAGLAVVAEAKASGMWHFMDDVDALIVPDDLQVALQGQPPAWENYEAFPDSVKRDILRWIKLAKREETRRKRIEKTANLAAKNERASGTR